MIRRPQPVSLLLLATWIALVFVGGGCRPDARPPSRAYVGPTEPLNEVVDAVNANNSRVPTLWSRGYFEANVADPRRGGRASFVNGDVVVLFRQGGDLRLVGKKDVAGTVFDVGSNADRYWLIVKGDKDTMWWGSHENIGRVDPRVMPLPPTLLGEVLGVGTIGRELMRAPVPVMRFNNDSDAYMIVWSMPLADRWAAQKEVWFDRQTKLPRLVILFDENGRVIVRAYLSNHKPVEVEGARPEDAPKVATNYKLYFPDSGTTMSFELNDVALTRSGAPSDRSFAFPGDNAGVSHVIQVDAPEPERDRDSPASATQP